MQDVDVNALRDYLYQHIPLSHAMQVSVIEANFDRVCLSAPLAPNINHRDTVFGGSASAVAILSAWALLYVRLKFSDIDARVVIQRNTMAYLQPVVSQFEACTGEIDAQRWHKFMRMLKMRGRARLHITASLVCEQANTAEFEGDFVAILPS